MKKDYSKRFLRSYAKAPLKIRKAFDKQVVLLMQDIRHPSLRAKKYDESQGIWQARIDKNWRFYFTIENDTYYFLDITRHPK